ncbi:MAG: 1-(5-phosphoribosyl)-5-amino-4-imidazole-carboxylate carboxylase, partial [Solirubrobacterales bacterium]
MDPKTLHALLEAVRKGDVSPDQAAEQLRTLPFEDLGFAKVDHHRALRRGFPEAVFGAGKTPEQIAAIVDRIAAQGQNVIVTRTTAVEHHRVLDSQPSAVFHETARCITLEMKAAAALPGRLAVVAAGTSDMPVAEEAAITASFYGATVDRI